MAPGLCAMGLFSLATSQPLKTGLAVSDGKSWISLLGKLLSFEGEVPLSCRVRQGSKWRVSWEMYSMELEVKKKPRRVERKYNLASEMTKDIS